MKLHIKSDFPEQFVSGASFLINKKERVTLHDVNLERGLVKINDISNPEDAKRYTNAKLFTTYEETRKNCHLNEGEYFFFDLEDCDVYEDGKLLGRVKEVERINISNYLSIVTDASLVEKGLPKSFLVPFHEPFKVAVDIDAKRIDLRGAMDILEAS
jgi:16S rRNA processing protein RimM